MANATIRLSLWFMWIRGLDYTAADWKYANYVSQFFWLYPPHISLTLFIPSKNQNLNTTKTSEVMTDRHESESTPNADAKWDITNLLLVKSSLFPNVILCLYIDQTPYAALYKVSTTRGNRRPKTASTTWLWTWFYIQCCVSCTQQDQYR